MSEKSDEQQPSCNDIGCLATRLEAHTKAFTSLAKLLNEGYPLLYYSDADDLALTRVQESLKQLALSIKQDIDRFYPPSSSS